MGTRAQQPCRQRQGWAGRPRLIRIDVIELRSVLAVSPMLQASLIRDTAGSSADGADALCCMEKQGIATSIYVRRQATDLHFPLRRSDSR